MVYISISQDKKESELSDCLLLFFYDKPNLVFSLHSVFSLGTFHERHGYGLVAHFILVPSTVLHFQMRSVIARRDSTEIKQKAEKRR